MNILKKLDQLRKDKPLEKKDNFFLNLSEKISNYRSDIQNLHQEIIIEISNSLKNTENKLNLLIKECQKILTEYHDSNDSIVKEIQKQKFKEKRKEAEQQKWKFIVQRECLGLLWTEELEKKYTIPNFDIS